MNESLLRIRLEKQIHDFRETFRGDIVFETMNGADCLRVNVRPRDLAETSPESDKGYSPIDFGYSSMEQLKSVVITTLRDEHKIPYYGHVKSSKRILPVID